MQPVHDCKPRISPWDRFALFGWCSVVVWLLRSGALQYKELYNVESTSKSACQQASFGFRRAQCRRFEIVSISLVHKVIRENLRMLARFTRRDSSEENRQERITKGDSSKAILQKRFTSEKVRHRIRCFDWASAGFSGKQFQKFLAEDCSLSPGDNVNTSKQWKSSSPGGERILSQRAPFIWIIHLEKQFNLTKIAPASVNELMNLIRPRIARHCNDLGRERLILSQDSWQNFSLLPVFQEKPSSRRFELFSRIRINLNYSKPISKFQNRFNWFSWF